MPKVSKYQVLGPYHEHSLQGQAKQFCSYNYCLNCDVTRPYQLVVRAKWACSLRFFLVKMSCFDRLLTKAAIVMSQKMADLVLVLWQSLRARGVGQDHVNPDFADSALLLPLNLYGEKRRPFCWANKTCRALL